MNYQLVIIGGGASGLAAAVTAATYGVERIAILEQLPRIGKKLLATGNGRCNLSHTDISAADYDGSFQAESVLAEFGNAPAFFENLGLFCRTDADGRMYPYSMAAASVLDAFLLRLKQDGTEIFCGQKVTGLERKGLNWLVRTEEAVYQTECVIFSAGGYAAPKLGTDGSTWKLLKKLGIPVVPPKPILCPVLSDAKMLYPLKGIRVKGRATLLEAGKPLSSEYGEIQMTEKALSGICMFNLSGMIRPDAVRHYTVSLDLFPEADTDEMLSRLYTCQAVRQQASAEDMLTGLVQKQIGRAILKACGIAADLPCSRITGGQLRALAEKLCDFRFPVIGLGDFSQAQATAGGVQGSALDADLQVKGHCGLYVTGEAVDIHAKCGGYHLHWCWASGAAAAASAAEKIRKGKNA